MKFGHNPPILKILAAPYCKSNQDLEYIRIFGGYQYTLAGILTPGLWMGTDDLLVLTFWAGEPAVH